MSTTPNRVWASNRWVQLSLGLICMMAISSPQYVWALLTKPLLAALGVKLSQLQITFSLLIVFQTFLSPLQGYLIERFGPRSLLSAGGVLTGLSWVLASQATQVTALYLTYGVLGGIGTASPPAWWRRAMAWEPRSRPFPSPTASLPSAISRRCCALAQG